MNQPLLQEGLYLMLYGMGTVFVFLIVLVSGTSLMSLIVQRYSSATVLEDDAVIAAISTAVHQYRKDHNTL